MSREDGFSRADVDVTMLDDLKFRRLWRLLSHQGYMAEATTIYLATVLRSWHDGMPATAEDASPPWLKPTADVLTALVEVGLIDKDHRIPKRAFDGWFRPAWERRERMRVGGRVGADRRWPSDRQTDIHTVNPIDTPLGTPIAPLSAIDPGEIPQGKKLRRRDDGKYEAVNE